MNKFLLPIVRNEGTSLTLIDAQFGEQRVETVDFLLLLNIGVVLGDSLESQLVHQVNDDWIFQTILANRKDPLDKSLRLDLTEGSVLYLESVHGDGEGGGEQQELPVFRKVHQNSIHQRAKVL